VVKRVWERRVHTKRRERRTSLAVIPRGNGEPPLECLLPDRLGQGELGLPPFAIGMLRNWPAT